MATVFVRRFLVRRDVGKEMLKAGMATVYEAKMGAEFGDFEESYREVEEVARKKKRGMWAGKMADYESPRAYKTRTAATKIVGQTDEKIPTAISSKDKIKGLFK